MSDLATSQNLAVARQVLGCLSTTGVAGLNDLCHDDLVMELPFTVPGFPAETVGKAACIDALQFIAEIFDSFGIQEHEAYECAAQDVVILEATSFGQRKNGGGSYQNRYVFVFKMRDGKLLSWREYFNPLRVRG